MRDIVDKVSHSASHRVEAETLDTRTRDRTHVFLFRVFVSFVRHHRVALAYVKVSGQKALLFVHATTSKAKHPKHKTGALELSTLISCRHGTLMCLYVCITF